MNETKVTLTHPMIQELMADWVTLIVSDDRIDYRVGNAAHTGLPHDPVDVVNLMFVLHELPADVSM